MLLNVLSSQLSAGGRDVEIPEALLYALIGFLVVFAGIALLIFVVWLVGKVMSLKTPVAAQTKTVAQQPLQAPSVVSNEVDEETVAVITAALMAYYQTNKPQCGFTVKRIKRI